MVTELAFTLRRPVLLLYSLLALALSSTLLLLALRRGPGEFWLWLIAYLGLGAFSVRFPHASPLVAGMMAFLLGFVRTYRGGYNLDLGLSLIALSVGLHLLLRARRGDEVPPLDLAGLSLLSIAAWSAISLAFAVIRIRSFAPAPGFAYRTYPFNALGFSSDEAVVRVVIGAAGAFIWFGLYEWARFASIDRKALNVAVFAALLVNAGALVAQHFDPRFLLPAGLQPIGRLNGVTSFCYALGDVTLALFLLLPAWGAWRPLFGALTVASLALLTHAAIASGSRSAVLAMLVTASLWAVLRAVRLARARRRLPALAILAAVLALVVSAGATYVMTPPNFTSPFGRLKEGVERHEGLVGHLVATRLSSYPLIFRVIAEYPLSGVGAGLYLAEVSKQHALLLPDMDIRDPYLRSSYAPNQFLNTGVELGLPALVALVLVFVSAAVAVLRTHGPGSADLAVSLLALAGTFQLGPGLLNSEALVFFWLLVGLAARPPRASAAPGNSSWTVGPRASAAILAGAAALGLVGQVLSRPALAVDGQWKRLRWRLNMGMHPPEPGGRWSGPEATFVVDDPGTAVVVRWHVGDQAAKDYRAEVSFYVDGALVQRSLASSGQVRESVLPLPAASGFKRISLRVSPPFVPAAALGGDDRRRLGAFIHSVRGRM